MKTLNYFVLSSIMIIIIAISCSKDEYKPAITQTTQTRTTIGNYSVIDGRLVFPTQTDYSNTLNYLDEATESQVNSFRNSISIETSAKALEAFRAATCCGIVLTDAQSVALRDQFASRVSFIPNGDNDLEVSFKYDALPEFTNINGEYKIGTKLMKQIGSKLFTVTNPTPDIVNSLTENTPTNLEQGIFVTETRSFPPDCPKPNCNSKHCEYSPKKFKLINEYCVKNISEHDYSTGVHAIKPVFRVTAFGKHERRKCFGLCWWVCDKVSLRHTFTITFTHIWPTLPSTLTFTPTPISAVSCNIQYSKTFTGNWFINLNGPSDPFICVTNVSQTTSKVGTTTSCTL